MHGKLTTKYVPAKTVNRADRAFPFLSLPSPHRVDLVIEESYAVSPACLAKCLGLRRRISRHHTSRLRLQVAGCQSVSQKWQLMMYATNYYKVIGKTDLSRVYKRGDPYFGNARPLLLLAKVKNLA